MTETEWGTIEESHFKLKPTLILKRAAYFLHWCCGKRMIRAKKITTAQCRHCDDRKVKAITVALCSVCNRHYETMF